VLKEANQPISDSVLNLMARTGSRMNNGRGFSSIYNLLDFLSKNKRTTFFI